MCVWAMYSQEDSCFSKVSGIIIIMMHTTLPYHVTLFATVVMDVLCVFTTGNPPVMLGLYREDRAMVFCVSLLSQ